MGWGGSWRSVLTISKGFRRCDVLVARPHPRPYSNYYLIFGLISETCLAVALAFCPGVSSVFRLHGLRWVGRGVARISEG